MRQIEALSNIILPAGYKNLSIAQHTSFGEYGKWSWRRHRKVCSLTKLCRRRRITIIIDSPPSLSLLTVNGMIAANYVLLPVQAEFYALEGWGSFGKYEIDKKGLNPPLELLGVC